MYLWHGYTGAFLTGVFCKIGKCFVIRALHRGKHVFHAFDIVECARETADMIRVSVCTYHNFKVFDFPLFQIGIQKA